MLSEALWRKRNLESIKEIEGKPYFTPRTNLSVCTISYFSMRVPSFIPRQQKQMETYLESCFDAIGIFLCIHIVHRYRILMHKRNVPALDK